MEVGEVVREDWVEVGVMVEEGEEVGLVAAGMGEEVMVAMVEEAKEYMVGPAMVEGVAVAVWCML